MCSSDLGLGVVLLTALLARAVAGDRAALIAAFLAALYPYLWVNDGLIMSESFTGLFVVGALLAAYRAILERMSAADGAVRGELVAPFLVDEALETPVDATAVQVAGDVARALGLDPLPVGVPYGSDASKLSRHGLDCLVFGPGSIDQAHAAVEWIETSQVERAAEFYREFCRRYA